MCIFRLWAEVADKYEKVLVLQPNDWRALWKWGSGLCIQAKASSVGHAFSLYKLACEKLLQAATIMPNFKTLYNAGNAHLNFAKLIGKNDFKFLLANQTVKSRHTQNICNFIRHLDYSGLVRHA
jgi:hypothetical protein